VGGVTLPAGVKIIDGKSGRFSSLLILHLV
jgi:hypothetical protein